MPKPTHCKTCGQRLRRCLDCGTDISDRDVRAIRCTSCYSTTKSRNYRKRIKAKGGTK